MENIEIVKKYFNYFLNNDTEQAFSLIADNAVWLIEGSANVPTVGRWEGKEKIKRFIQNFEKSFTPLEFDLKHYFTSDDNVFVIGHFKHLIKSTGKTVNSDFMIEFKIQNHKIASYHILEDSYALYLAFLN